MLKEVWQLTSSTLTGRAHTLQTKIDRLKKMAVARPKEQKKLNVGFDEERKSSKRVITAKDLTVTTPEGRKILDVIDLDIHARERVALIGANGSGKINFCKIYIRRTRFTCRRRNRDWTKCKNRIFTSNNFFFQKRNNNY